ncbi:MAG: glycosyltransferase family 39 protein [Planctomycetota bacterium]
MRPLLLLVGLAVLYLLTASLTTLWDRDEPRFARAAVEMVDSGDYLVPRFDGELRPDKPPMVYWWMAPWIVMFGSLDLVVRIPSILGVLIAALATFHIGRNMAGDRVAIRAALISALMPLPFVIGTAATADGLLLAGVSVSLAILVDRALHGFRSIHLLLLTLSLSFSLLAKGPVGLVIFLLAAATASFWGREVLQFGKNWWGHITVASLLALGIFLCWGIPANQATGGELARIGIGRHLLQRSTEALESHGGEGVLGWILGLPFYVPILLLGAAPSSALLVPLTMRARSLLGSRRNVVLIAALILPTLLLMTLVATKLPHYILPAFPGIAVAVALVWTRAEEGLLAEEELCGWPWQIGRWSTALLLLGLATLWCVTIQHSGGDLSLAIPGSLSFCVATFLTLRMKPGSKFCGSRGLARPIGMTALGIFLVAFAAGVMEGQWKVAGAVAQAIEESAEAGLKADGPVLTLGYDEPSLVFALDRESAPGQKSVTGLKEQYPGGISQWVQSTGPSWLLVSVTERSGSGVDLESHRCRMVWATAPSGIVNYSTGKTVVLELWLLAGS